MEKLIQARSEKTGIKTFDTVKEAIEEALEDKSIWKISFDIPTGERVRLELNKNNEWIYVPTGIKSLVKDLTG